MKQLIIAAGLLLVCSYAWSHAEHDKPRYVASDGVDIGECDKVDAPCRTIGYAVSKSNKGDIVLVASGSYVASDVNEVVHLTSNLVKIKAGYSTEDKYHKRNAKKHVTYITGVPSEFRKAVADKGFTVIADTKAMSATESAQLKSQLASVKALSEKQADVECVDGAAGTFPCSGLDLVSHTPYNNFAETPNSGNDIWGHIDLNTGKEYALIGVQNGVTVFDISDPEYPVEVGHAPGVPAGWRDIKTYQYYSEADKRWYAYAYSSTDGNAGGIAIINLSGLPESISLVDTDLSNNNVHNIYISNVDYSTGVAINGGVPQLHVMGSNLSGGAFRTYSLANPEQLTPVYVPTDKTRDDYTHDGASTTITDDRVTSQCVNGTDRCDVFVDFNEQQMLLWDQTVPDDPKALSSTTYGGASYVHSGWWTEDNKFIYLHDELDEQRLGLNSTIYIFNVSDLTSPVRVGTWTGPTRAIDHNGFVRGNRYYMSNYQRGVTVLDISSPATPEEVGYFDTYPIGNAAQFNGVWGVYPFLPSGLILASDIGSGLYVLRDNTREVPEGQLQFKAAKYYAVEGSNATIEIERVGGSTGEVTVQYQTRTGSATEADYSANSGVLTWADGDTSSKTIEILTTTDTNDDEADELFFVTLFDPQNGAALGQHKSTQVIISQGTVGGVFAFNVDETVVYEGVDFTDGNKTIDFEVSRFAGSTGEITMTIEFDDSSDAAGESDVSFSTTSLTWADGDMANKSFQVSVSDDDESETVENVVIKLTPSDVSAMAASTTTIRIVDDESNAAPTVSGQDDSSVAYTDFDLSKLFTITDDNVRLSYQYAIESMPSNAEATLENSQLLQAAFSASGEGDYVVSLTVSDPFGVSASANATLTIKPSGMVVDAPKSKSSSSSMAWLFMFAGLLLVASRRLIKQ